MNSFLTRFLLLIAAVFCFLSPVQADSNRARNSYQAKIVGLAGINSLIPDAVVDPGLQEARRSPNLRLSAAIPGLGRVRIKFNKERLRKVVPTITDEQGSRPDTAGITLLQGEVKLKNSSDAVAGSIYHINGSPHLFVGFVARHFRSGHPKYFRLNIPLQNSSGKYLAHVSKASRFVKPGTCGSSALLGAKKSTPTALASAHSHSGPIMAEASYGVIELNIDGDQEWYNRFGSNSNSKISTFINEAEAIYQRDLDLTYDIVRQNVFSTRSFGTSNGEDKLTKYREYSIAQSYYDDVDTNHLFTGNMMDWGVLGIAYSGLIGEEMGVVCRFPSYSFGVTSFSAEAYVPITFAHEIGHNFSAQHDDVTFPKTIMAAMLGEPLPSKFSDFSIGEITGYVGKYGNCIASGSGPTPTPTPTATPTPSGTSTPTPSASPTPTDTGGGGGGSGDETPAPVIPVTLTAKLNKMGVFRADVQIGTANSSCTVQLLASSNRSQILQKGKKIATYPATTLQKSFLVKVKKKASVISSKGKASKAYIAAQIICPDGSSGTSMVKKLKPQSIKSSKSVKLNKWYKLLGKELKRSL